MRGVAAGRVISTVDPGARHGRKSTSGKFVGYKGDVAIDPDSERITETPASAANAGDGPIGRCDFPVPFTPANTVRGEGDRANASRGLDTRISDSLIEFNGIPRIVCR